MLGFAGSPTLRTQPGVGGRAPPESAAMNAGAGAAAAAAAVVIANATKASGVIVRVDAHEFLKIVQLAGDPLVVHATGGLLRTHYRYLTSYKGLAFYLDSLDAVQLPRTCEVVSAKKIWVPD